MWDAAKVALRFMCSVSQSRDGPREFMGSAASFSFLEHRNAE